VLNDDGVGGHFNDDAVYGPIDRVGYRGSFAGTVSEDAAKATNRLVTVSYAL